MSRVILVAGHDPKNVCGVGDYTRTLAVALEKAGVQTELFFHSPWGVSGTRQALRRLSSTEGSLVHIQYPTEGYGHSLGPQLCAMARASVVTLHEFSFAHPLRKLSMLPFALRSLRLVMTSEFEKRSLLSKMPWADRRIRVIPIGSNIPPAVVPSGEPRKRLVYFGLIMPRKGLEDFIELARLVRADGLDWELVMIGRILERHTAYAQRLRELSFAHGVRWVIDPGPEEIAGLLSHAQIAYFPFPDGASERRGSLKAALAAGLPCITTLSERTPPEMRQAVAFAASASDAFALAARWMQFPQERQKLQDAALRYAQSFSWETIAAEHVRMYEELLTMGPKQWSTPAESFGNGSV